ncbi:unnamed protein product [Cochlearia groenlandica]
MAVCVLLIMVVIAMILILHFSSPDSPKVTLVSLTASKFNLSTGDHISGHLNLQFQVLNPNLKKNFLYDDITISVYYGKHHHLASTVFPGFVHKKIETMPINITVRFEPGTMVRGISYDLTTYGFVKFDVKLSTLVYWRPWQFGYFRCSCDGVEVGLLSETGGHGEMIGPERNCEES